MDDITTCTTAEEVASVIKLLKKITENKAEVYESTLDSSDAEILNKSWQCTFLGNLNRYKDESKNWQHLSSVFYILYYLDNAFLHIHDLECLSVQQTKDVKTAIGVVIEQGIMFNLQSGKDATRAHSFSRYKQLCGTLYGLSLAFKSPLMKSLLTTSYLKPVLLAFHQIIYCPLKKPNVQASTDFLMTQELYNELVKDRDDFKHIFKGFVTAIHPMLYIRETMLLLDKTSPTWLKRSLSLTLSGIIHSPKGVQNVVLAMFDSVGLDELDDSTKSWNVLFSIAKLITDTHKCSDFKENICTQLCDLLKLQLKSNKPFERLFALCAKLLYQQNQELCNEAFITKIIEPLMCFTIKWPAFQGEIDNRLVQQSIRLCYYSTSEDHFDVPVLPVHCILPIVQVVFNLFLVSDSKSSLYNDSKNILINALAHLSLNQQFTLFDTFMFGFSHTLTEDIQTHIEFSMQDSELIIKRHSYTFHVAIATCADAISNLICDIPKVKMVFFLYLLNCLTEPDKYFNSCGSNTELLELEHTNTIQEASECSLVVYKVLSELASDENIQKEINENPTVITKYINTALQNCVRNKTHTNATDTSSFQTLFLLVMLLQIFVENSTSEAQNYYASFIELLRQIQGETESDELKDMCKDVLVRLERGKSVPKSSKSSMLDSALEDICDPLLPVRGHALMVLSKLIEAKDDEAMGRKQYILNIFMQNLKNDDSFIYLSAIGGLSSLGNVFPETILKTLADEYTDFSRKDTEDGYKVRMKIGEALVRITKTLGEMASKYKTLLLNTFLEVSKDDDHLMRCSSLSNLGEVCKVLGYKLGTIINEVLVCVHAVIATDKAPEPRRAAVSVIRQLFVGLEKEMIVFLKDDILPIYRTLKNIYYNDKDDIMRLQAQLALEQLNENMKDFIFPNPQLHTEKKVIMLN